MNACYGSEMYCPRVNTQKRRIANTEALTYAYIYRR